VYLWADGIYFNIRNEDDRQCILVIGVTGTGTKELLGLEAGFQESDFATVRLRTNKTQGCVSQDSILSLVFKLVQSAQKRWLRIRGFKCLAEVIEAVKFKDGIRADQQPDSNASKNVA